MLYLFSARSLVQSPFRLGFRSSPWTLAGAGAMVLLQMLFTYAPFMNRIFGSAPMSAGLWLDVLGVSVAIFLLVGGGQVDKAAAVVLRTLTPRPAFDMVPP